MNKTIIIILLIAVGGFFSFFVISPAMWAFHLRSQIQQHKKLIVEETNHKELFIACKELMENQPDYFETDDPNWPAIIKKLKPSYVSTSENVLIIGIASGWFGFGIIVCEEEPEWSSCEHTKLLDGMWFYEEK